MTVDIAKLRKALEDTPSVYGEGLDPETRAGVFEALDEMERLRAENAELQKNLEMSKFALAQFGLQIYNPSDTDAP